MPFSWTFVLVNSSVLAPCSYANGISQFSVKYKKLLDNNNMIAKERADRFCTKLNALLYIIIYLYLGNYISS